MIKGSVYAWVQQNLEHIRVRSLCSASSPAAPRSRGREQGCSASLRSCPRTRSDIAGAFPGAQAPARGLLQRGARRPKADAADRISEGAAHDHPVAHGPPRATSAASATYSNGGKDTGTMPWPTFVLLFLGPACTLARYATRRAITRSDSDSARNICERIRYG